MHRVALVHGRSNPLGFDARQLGLAHALAGHAGHFGTQGVLDLLRRLALGGHAAEQKQAGAASRHHGRTARAVGHALGALAQGALQACTVVAAEHGRQHHQRQGIAVGIGERLDPIHAGHAKRQGHIGLLGRGLDGNAAQALLCGLGARLARRQGTGGQAAIVFFGQRAHLGHIHITGHHHRRVAGHIPLAVESAHVLGRQGVQIAHPAHHRAAVGRGHEGGRKKLFGQKGTGLVFGAQTALFLDHLDFALELVIGPLVVRKAVGLQAHHVFQTVRGNLLVIACVVAAGEGVFLTTQRCHPARKLARRHGLGALEHHVLQHMGHARGAIDLVHGAHAQPHHVHGRGRTAVGLHDELHAIGQRELLRARSRGSLRGQGRWWCRKGGWGHRGLRPGTQAGQQAQKGESTFHRME